MATIAQFRGMSLMGYPNDHNLAYVHVRKGNEWVLKIELGNAEYPSKILEDTYSKLVPAKWRTLAIKLVEDNLDDCWATWNQFHHS